MNLIGIAVMENTGRQEIGGDYSFKLISDMAENGSKAAERFIEKITAGVKNKILSIEPESDAYLSNKGDIHIEYDEERDSMIFVIDGKRVLPDELAECLSCFEGFDLQYAIRDESEPLLGEDEYLIPVKITRDTLVEELEEKINMYSDGGFLSYKILSLFQDWLYGHIDKLEVLYRYNREDAVGAGKEMIRMLEGIEHDDDFFPEAERQLIMKIITKYGPVEE